MHGTLAGKKLISLVIIVAFTAVSCTSYKVVEPPRIETKVKEGDTIRIVTTDGRQVKFKVTAISSDAIAGESQHILFSDIAKLEIQQKSPTKTAGLVGGILLGTAALFFGIVYLICDYCH